MADPSIISSLFSLEGLTAIVTGSTGGLGSAMTLALAEGGASIISIELPDDPASSTLASSISNTGRKLTKYTCDVSSSTALRETFAKIFADGHQADILLNCAGIQRRSAAEDFTDATIDEVLDVNLKATFVACQEFAKYALPRGRGKIINVGSIISFIGGNNISAYAASKGGVLQITKAFSSEWAGRGLNVNVICPGYFKTDMTKQYSEDPK
jgi:2-dehydro-3-deoxy-D-gluconate 5-dehydrogenase